MEFLQTSIEDLSDADVVKVTNKLFNIVYAQISYEEVLRNSAKLAETSIAQLLTDDSLGHEMTTTESAEICRFVLEMYAQNSEIAPFLQQAWEEVNNSDTLFVEEILVLGVIINLTLLNATTTVDLKKDFDGNVTVDVSKKEASPDMIKALFSPLFEIVRKIGIK